MKVLFAGTPPNAAEVLKGIVEAGHEVVAVLTREDALTGRKKILTPSAVAVTAKELGIPTIKANRITDEIKVKITQTKADLAIVVAYGMILTQETLDLLPEGWFNLHFSLLPKWRGAAPVQRAIAEGDTETGVALFKIDSGLDTGPLLGTVATPIGPDETSGELISRLTKLGLTLVNAELPNIYSGVMHLEPQIGEPSKASKPTRLEAKISFDARAEHIDDLVRAMNPEPMAWCLLNDQPMRVIRSRQARINSRDLSKQIGSLHSEEGKVFVCCGDDTWLELIEVQPASRNVMSAKDWFNGLGEIVVLK